MTLLNVTQKLSDRIGIKQDAILESKETLLGSWTAHLFYSGHHQFIIVTNEQTLLTVLLPVKELRNIETVLPQKIDELLRNYGVSDQIRLIVVRQLTEIQYDRNTKRRVLGSMNDFVRLAKYFWEDEPSMTISQLTDRLNEVPCSPLKGKSAKAATIEILQNK